MLFHSFNLSIQFTPYNRVGRNAHCCRLVAISIHCFCDDASLLLFFNQFVGSATRPIMVQSPKSQTVKLGNSVDLHCRGLATPMPKVHWLKNGMEVIENGKTPLPRCRSCQHWGKSAPRFLSSHSSLLKVLVGIMHSGF